MQILIQDQPFEKIEFQAVLFDLDGTLVESTGLISDILSHWAVEQGLDADAVLTFSHGKRTQDIVANFIHDESCSLHYQKLTEKFLAASVHTQAIQAAATFIQTLNQHHVPWAVVSSSERELIFARMQAADLPIPEYVVAAEDIVQGKPNPEGYLNGAKLLHIPIEQCVVFEDSAAGIQAAEAAGAQVIVVGAEDAAYPHISDFGQIKYLD